MSWTIGSDKKNVTYIAEAWEVGGSLKQVQEKLEECLDLLQKTAPMENGVILEAPLLKSSIKKNSRGMEKKKATSVSEEKSFHWTCGSWAKTK